MRILIVAATEGEIAPLRAALGGRVDFLITGVGVTATAFALGECLAKQQFDLALNLGIAGSFDRSLELGSVVEVSQDVLADLGAEDGDDFLSLSELGLGENSFGPTAQLKNLPGGFSLPLARAITVNTVHGNEATIQRIQNRLQPQLESMEGAAFFFACRRMNLPCLQVRAVSNYVEKRNRAAWQIGPAITELNRVALALLEKTAGAVS